MRNLVTVYLMVIAFLIGMVSEKILHGAERDAVIARYERALADWRAVQIRSEKAAAEERNRRATAQVPGAPAAPAAGEGAVLPPLDR